MGLLWAVGCGKKDSQSKSQGDPKSPIAMEAESPTPSMGARVSSRRPPAMAPVAEPESAVKEWVTVTLPSTKLKMKVPKGTKVEKGIIPNTDSIKPPGAIWGFGVRKARTSDKPLDKAVAYARSKGHTITIYQSDVLKKGSGKLFTYIYRVKMSGNNRAIFAQYLDVGEQRYRCFSNALSVPIAKLYHRCCSSLAK